MYFREFFLIATQPGGIEMKILQKHLYLVILFYQSLPNISRVNCSLLLNEVSDIWRESRKWVLGG